MALVRSPTLGNAGRKGVVTLNIRLVTPKWDEPFHGFKIPSYPTDARQQFVYLLESPAHPGLLKIGVANNIENRIRSLEAGNPGGIALVGFRQIDRVLAFQVERRVHGHFKDRLHGREWFKVSRDEALPVIDLWCRRARAALKYYRRLGTSGERVPE